MFVVICLTTLSEKRDGKKHISILIDFYICSRIFLLKGRSEKDFRSYKYGFSSIC